MHEGPQSKLALGALGKGEEHQRGDPREEVDRGCSALCVMCFFYFKEKKIEHF